MRHESLVQVLQQAIEVLQRGGTLLYPADTIWGIGCDATNPEAVKRIYEIKGREHNKPFIVLVASFEQLYTVVEKVHPRVDTLLNFHERPLTIIYPKARPEYVHLANKDGSIGVRLVLSGFCHELLEAYGRPLISTSANIAGEPSPTTFGTISTDIIRQVDFAMPPFTEKGMTGKPSAIARYNSHGELDFIR